MNYNHNDSSIITIGTITGINGVSIITGYIAPYEGNQQEAETNLSSNLLQGIPGVQYSVTDIQVGGTSVNGTSPGNNTFRNPSSSLGRPYNGAYVNFTEPFMNNSNYWNSWSGNYSFGDHFQWVFYEYDQSSYYTTFWVYNMDHNSQGHYNETSFTRYGVNNVQAFSKQCLFVKNSYNKVSLNKYNYVNGNFTENSFDFSTILGNISQQNTSNPT